MMARVRCGSEAHLAKGEESDCAQPSPACCSRNVSIKSPFVRVTDRSCGEKGDPSCRGYNMCRIYTGSTYDQNIPIPLTSD